MGKITLNEAENYSTAGSTWFTLKDNGDTAKVRFMYESIDDVEMCVVHEVTVNGKTRYVSCLRNYDDPVDDCPLCRAGSKQLIKLFIPVYNIDKKEVQVWQRGKTFANTITSLIGRYSPLCGTPLEIERQGAKGDTSTKYQIYPCDKDGITLKDLPELPKIIGGAVLDKSFDELEYYAQNGSFKSEAVAERRQSTAVEPKISRRPAF